MKIEKYGLKMIGLKVTSDKTSGLQGFFSGQSLEVHYNIVTGQIFTHYHDGSGRRGLGDYSNKNIIRVWNFCDPTTMQEIADAISGAVRCHNEEVNH